MRSWDGETVVPPPSQLPNHPPSSITRYLCMKILHIIDSGGLYGAEIMLLNLVSEQIKQNLEPIIASIGEKRVVEKPLETEAIRRGFKVKKFRMIPGPNYSGAMRILSFAHKEGVDILHSHGYKGNLLFGLMPRKIRKAPILSTLHGWTSTAGFSKMWVYEWLDRKSLKHIDAVVVVSNAMKSHPKLKGLKGINFHVIPNGIPIKKHNNPFPVTSDLNSKVIDFCNTGFTFGAIGRLSPEKSYGDLIKALVLLNKKGIDARLVIVGEGRERSYLEGLAAQYALSEKLLMPGYLEEAKRYIPFFNIFAISSLTEGLPITLLEAMQSKVPIVATNVGGIPEVLNNGEAGWLIKPCMPEEIAEAIDSLCHNEKLASEFKAKAYHRLFAYYSSKQMAKEYLNIYNRLI